eukprot:CAMPEP_0202689134 /NCGR_PEP_ID=MMETSP1385-20130828/4475_1 /ASSEMBLY_ACC=CAM_ASM_000861 /TAXON_ID=933848 /ORGANISM="Elphidium margaritaceum" /LENGTH=130 /DNA_ID=CAMNT_0049344227 /DNA_START=129 /DNA_END=521 /DNA_ORIENTATION=+
MVAVNNSQMFMLFWSLFSGFGIIFALLSWVYDINGIKVDPFFPGFKGVVALSFGLCIGLIHYKLSMCVQDDNENKRKNNESDPGGRSSTKDAVDVKIDLSDSAAQSELQSINTNETNSLESIYNTNSNDI